MVDIIGTQDYAFHEPIAGYQLNILWQNTPVPLTIFRSNSKFHQNLECSTFKVCLTDHNILHTSRQLHCLDMYKILLWLVEYISNQSTVNFGRISNSIEISLVGWAPGCTCLTTDGLIFPHYTGGPWWPPPPKLQISEVTWPHSRFNTSGPDPLRFDWEGMAASRGTAGGHSGPPIIKQPRDCFP